MESILARALEYTLKYWLKSFSRDQFKLQGRTVQLSNLDIDGDALHASVGFPPALNVTTAKVGKLEIILPSVSNVQVEPIVVQIDRLDLVLEENDNIDESTSSSSAQTSASSAKGSGYGFADKIADGMTLEVGTVNLLVETHGGARRQGGATWAPPMASITIRNLLLYTTNEDWQVVNLKEARDFSNNKGSIYVFKKLEWEFLSIDLLPHPDMFLDAHMASSQEGSSRKDADGAKRAFFGGERFIEGISGEAYITIQRTELNSPLGLEVQLHVSEVVCPAFSEPGLRALLRFFTGFYGCLNRGDVNPNGQRSTEAAGRSLVSIIIDHIFLCIKDAEFQLELLMQSLFFSRASISDGEKCRNLTQVMVGGFFLRDTFSRPPCTLVQPSVHISSDDVLHIPDFAKSFCPPIYPLGDDRWRLNVGVPLICLHSLQIQPSPAPPDLASQTVVECQPLMIYLQEESCLRITSLLVDGVTAGPGSVLSESSISSMLFSLKGLDVTVPLDNGIPKYDSGSSVTSSKGSFTGATLHIENLFFSDSPSLKLKLLNLEKDPACFCLWEGQPIDASQKKWTSGASLISLCLETSSDSAGASSGLWTCVELKEVCLEVAMATVDGKPLTHIPPPGGIVRVGVACDQFLSNTSVEQLFFVLELYTYFGQVSEKISIVGKRKQILEVRDESLGVALIDKVPGDTAVSISLKSLQLRFLETVCTDSGRLPLVQFVGEDLYVKVNHRTLGGAMMISSIVQWESVEVDCADTPSMLSDENVSLLTSNENMMVSGNGSPQLRAVFWVQRGKSCHANSQAVSVPFLNVRVVHVIPYDVQDVECHSLNVSACVGGVRLGGGMGYAESLLHRFGILGPDGGPGVGLTKGLEQLAAGPLSKLFKPSPFVDEFSGSINNAKFEDKMDSSPLQLGTPDDVDVVIELKDWLFALEGEDKMAERWQINSNGTDREKLCWHTTFQNMIFKGKSSPKSVKTHERSKGIRKYPVEFVTVGLEGFEILKPLVNEGILENGAVERRRKQNIETCGVNAEVDIGAPKDDVDGGGANWIVNNLKFSVKQPIEAVVTKDELHYLVRLLKTEVESMGRIAAGLLRVLKLEGSIGPAAINQLSNLGVEGFDKILNPDKSSDNPSCNGFNSFTGTNGGVHSLRLEETVSSLEEMILDSQAKCAALTSEIGSPEFSAENLDNVKQLSQKLESMQKLLIQLRTQI
ncbi:OLC1v1022843C1 [Oldenlandia corymbosa var. corymbosa]|uniref:OLC1v1022843C1 n=1 Tax=Oldenlandia corymbosa var. corymbosa TaxID=529605 RepID=A0AAV1BZF3_OLDCO|nr:OLC1v1022843C1 [Oldenlandia corymbosa var. corymbosa]